MVEGSVYAGVVNAYRLAADLAVFYVVLFRERQVQQYSQGLPAKRAGNLCFFLHRARSEIVLTSPGFGKYFGIGGVK
jgi:hypothetical protein